MAVSELTNRAIGNGNGVARTFSFSPVIISKSSDLVVVKRELSGDETPLSEGSSSSTYSVSVSAYPGTGSIDYPASGGSLLVTGESLSMKSVRELTQSTDLNNRGGYFSDTQETAFDKLTYICQQQQEEIDRAVKIPITDTSTSTSTLTANIITLAAISSDISSVSTVSANVTTVAGISANVTTVAGISANVTTVAGISANVTTVAGISANVTTVAGISTDITTLAPASSDISSVASLSFKFLFDSSTTMADPGSGSIRYNNATPASVTQIAISNTFSGGADISNFINVWDDATNAVAKAYLFIRKGGSGTVFQVFKITGAITDNTTWLQIPVTHSTGTTLPSDTDALYLSPSISGEDGASSGLPQLIDTNADNISYAFDLIQDQHGLGVLLMESGFSDSFEASNDQGADESASSGYEYDAALDLYKGVTGGTAINSDFPFTTESNYIQKEESLADVSISGNTVTVNTGSVGANVLNARFSVDDFANEAIIAVRTDSTHFDLPAGHGLTGTNVAGRIRFIQLLSGVAKLSGGPEASDNAQNTQDGSNQNLNGGTGTLEELGQNFTAGTTGTLTKLTASIFKLNSPTDSVTFEIFAVDGSGFPTGSALSDAPSIVASTLDATAPGTAQTFTFNSPASVVNGTKYAAVMKRTGSRDATNRTGWDESGAAPLANGTMIKKDSGTWSNLPGDAYFETFITPASNVINEAAAIVPAFTQLKSAAPVTDINSIAITETLNSQTAQYAFIFGPAGMTAYNDTDTLVTIFNQTGSVWKKALNWTGAKWQYNSDTNNTTATTWTDSASATDFPTALAEALNTNAALAMTGTQAAAITDAEFEASGGFVVGTHTQYGVGVVLKSTNSAQNPQVDLIRTNWDADRAAMVLQSKTYDPGIIPATGYLWARAEHSVSDGPGTFEVTRDGGTTWATVTMTEVFNITGGNQRVLSGTVDLSAQPSAQDLRYKYSTTQAKDQFLHAVGLQGRS